MNFKNLSRSVKGFSKDKSITTIKTSTESDKKLALYYGMGSFVDDFLNHHITSIDTNYYYQKGYNTYWMDEAGQEVNLFTFTSDNGRFIDNSDYGTESVFRLISNKMYYCSFSNESTIYY